MAELGCINELKVIEEAPYGVILDGGRTGKIMLPGTTLPPHCKVGDSLKVFVYLGPDQQVTATLSMPRATVGQFAYLKVVAISAVGAFMDWGLPKDLLVPKNEQSRPMKDGQYYLVYINLDDVGRVVGSSKIEKFLDRWPARYEEGQEVELMICERSDIGTKAIINNRHWGMLYDQDTFRKLRFGEKTRGYIKRLREDGKIDLILHKPGIEKVEQLTDVILARLEQNGGSLPLNDKSSPEEIYKTFGESKKSFKSAIGMLYKQKRIIIDADGIRLTEKT